MGLIRDFNNLKKKTENYFNTTLRHASLYIILMLNVYFKMLNVSCHNEGNYNNKMHANSCDL